jgi:hypothetical protein
VKPKTQITSDQHADQLNTAFAMTSSSDALTFPEAVHEVAVEEELCFSIHEDTPQDIILQLHNIAKHAGRKDFIKIISPCEWKGKECSTTHLLRDCDMFKKKKPRDRMLHLKDSNRCFNCMRKGHMSKDCKSPIRCKCGARHNIALHKAWQEKIQEVAFLTKVVSAVSLLRSPIIVSTENSALKLKTNVIHDNGSTVSLCSQELADAIGLTGEERPLGLAVFGNPNQVQPSCKATVSVADSERTHVGQAIVSVVK